MLSCKGQFQEHPRRLLSIKTSLLEDLRLNEASMYHGHTLYEPCQLISKASSNLLRKPAISVMPFSSLLELLKSDSRLDDRESILLLSLQIALREMRDDDS